MCLPTKSARLANLVGLECSEPKLSLQMIKIVYAPMLSRASVSQEDACCPSVDKITRFLYFIHGIFYITKPHVHQRFMQHHGFDSTCIYYLRTIVGVEILTQKNSKITFHERSEKDFMLQQFLQFATAIILQFKY